MDLNNASVSCNINIEWLNAQAVVIRKIANKYGTLKIIRNDLRELFIEVSLEKQQSPIKMKIKSISVHKKFMAEGKASIKFADDKCTLFLSNAPPGILVQFLKTLFIKMTSENAPDKSKEDIQKNIRAHMLSGKPSQFEEISPITNSEFARAKKLAVSNSTITTPSPPQNKKRRMMSENDDTQKPLPKKLYVPSPLAATTMMSEKLNEEQEQILQACLGGKNLFFTGSAGTGKSFLLRKIISTLQPEGTVATASTGVAACLIGGVTLHSFAGIGGGEATLKRCYEMASRTVVAQTWRKCKRLIIDEISMVDGEYFEKIEAVARFIRRNEKPFGGIQLILCGDFLQLPPVVKLNRTLSLQEKAAVKRFCFQSPAWQKCMQMSFELQKVHRQKDQKFVDILNHIRIGRVTEDVTTRLLATSGQKIEQNGILATQLCSHTNDADLINQSKLNNLNGEEKTFEASDENCDSYMSKQLDQQVPAPGKLVLKIGAQVMLLKNINVSNGLVNGARGVVMKYVDGCPLVKFKNNREYMAKPEKWIIKMPTGGTVARRQVPLKLAWAFSIHKSQGLTLDCVEMSLSKVFEAGQAYVALSRAQSLDSLRVLDFDAKQVWANPDVLQYYRVFRRQLLNLSVIPLGPAGARNNNDKHKLLKKSLSDLKLKKSLMGKPLVNIS